MRCVCFESNTTFLDNQCFLRVKLWSDRNWTICVVYIDFVLEGCDAFKEVFILIMKNRFMLDDAGHAVSLGTFDQ
jgi:hypothetical protein